MRDVVASVRDGPVELRVCRRADASYYFVVQVQSETRPGLWSEGEAECTGAGSDLYRLQVVAGACAEKRLADDGRGVDPSLAASLVPALLRRLHAQMTVSR